MAQTTLGTLGRGEKGEWEVGGTPVGGLFPSGANEMQFTTARYLKNMKESRFKRSDDIKEGHFPW